MLSFLNKKTVVKNGVSIAIILLLGLSLEVFFFNFRSIESLFFCNSERSALGNPNENVFVANSDNSIVISCDDEDINNISLKFDPAEKIDFSVLLIDEGSAEQYPVLDKSNSSGGIFRIHPYGKVQAVEIQIDSDKSVNVSVAFNVQVPMDFSIKRVICLTILFLVGWLVRPSSCLHKQVLTKRFAFSVAFISDTALKAKEAGIINIMNLLLLFLRVILVLIKRFQMNC